MASLVMGMVKLDLESAFPYLPKASLEGLIYESSEQRKGRDR